MKYLDPFLKIKKSTFPNTGKGLFTNIAIPKGTRITEYQGKVSSWKDVNHHDGTNGYIFYVSRNHVIDARGKKNSFAHFANDAAGFKRINGLKNNAAYTIEGKKVFMDAIKNIPAGAEIFVGYGKEYWQVLKKNGVI